MKMTIYGTDYAKEILDLVPSKNLEVKYGGESPTVE
jgi:hypothetical protein